MKSLEVPLQSKTARAARGAFQIPSLDGLRAISFMLVFLSHAGASRIVPAHLGVTIFFFLSGYLITTLLRMEFDRTGEVNLKHFYLRRILRIFPPFYLVLAIACGLTLVGALHGSLRLAPVLAQVCHISNYWILHEDWSSGRALGTAVFWSLAVEEHFYLVFPLLYLFLRRRVRSVRQQMFILVGLCAAALLWRCFLIFVLHVAKDRTGLATDTRADSILLGCILAMYGNPALDATRISDRWWKACWLPLGAAMLVLAVLVRDMRFQETFRYTLEGLALFPIFIVAVRFPDWGPCRFLNLPWVRFVGTLSYSLYLVHQLVLFLLEQWLPGRPALQGVLTFGGSLLLAALIHQWVEKPCARLRKRFAGAIIQPRSRPVAGAAPDTGSWTKDDTTPSLVLPRIRTEVEA